MRTYVSKSWDFIWDVCFFFLVRFLGILLLLLLFSLASLLVGLFTNIVFWNSNNNNSNQYKWLASRCRSYICVCACLCGQSKTFTAFIILFDLMAFNCFKSYSSFQLLDAKRHTVLYLVCFEFVFASNLHIIRNTFTSEEKKMAFRLVCCLWLCVVIFFALYISFVWLPKILLWIS